ncbi:hypothetical protein HDU93_003975 [Gonapodya sp. JEL0774]|nr:hypothetical protein HDU93_003975 [Gonapodya sp. JEL0774]
MPWYRLFFIDRFPKLEYATGGPPLTSCLPQTTKVKTGLKAFTSLPNELQHYLFDSIGDHRTLLDCRLVSRTFERLSTAVAFRNLRPKSAAQSKGLFRIFIEAFKSTQLDTNDEYTIDRALRVLRSVRSFDMRALEDSLEESLPYITATIKGIDLAGLNFFAFPETLDGVHGAVFVEDVMRELAERAQNIRSLVLANAEAMKGSATWSLFQSIMPRLSNRLTIVLDTPDGSRGDPTTLGSWNKIKCLDVGAWATPQDHPMDASMAWGKLIPQFSCLTTFAVMGLEGWGGSPTRFGSKELQDLFHAAPRLRRLYLDTTGNPQCAQVIAQYGAKLTSLSLKGSVPKLFSLLASLPKLSNFGLLPALGNLGQPVDAEMFSKAFASRILLALQICQENLEWKEHIPHILRLNSSVRRLWIGSSRRRGREVSKAVWNSFVTQPDSIPPQLRCLRLDGFGIDCASFEVQLTEVYTRAQHLEIVFTAFNEQGTVYERDAMKGVLLDGTRLWRLPGACRLVSDGVDFLDPDYRPLIVAVDG